MAIFEHYVFLRYEMPHLATFVVLVLAGLIFSHLLNYEEISSVFSPILAKIAQILSIIASIPWFFIAGGQIFHVVLDILGTGFGPFFLHIPVAVLGFLVGYSPSFIYSFLYTAKLKKNPVTKKAVELAKKLQATTMVCCYDGVYLSKLPIPAYSSTRSCKFEDEYNKTQEKLTSIQAFCPPGENHNLIVFADEGFEDMSRTGMTAFSEAFCKLMKGFQSQRIEQTVTYTQPAYSNTTNSAYYTVNGNLCGGPTTTYVKEKTLSKIIDFYVVSSFVDPSSKKAQPTPKVSPKKHW